MTVTYVTVSPAQGTNYTLSTYDWDLFIAAGVTVAATSGIAGAVVTGQDSDHNIFLAGAILCIGTAVRLGNEPAVDFSNSIKIADTGQIVADYVGIYASSMSATISNDGYVSGYRNGIEVHSGTSGNVSIMNTGTIDATLGTAIVASALYGHHFLSITNSGTIQSATGGAVVCYGFLTFSNSGLVIGAVSSGYHNDSLTNTGEIYGNVNLGQGDDVFKTFGSLFGDVNLGADNNILLNRGALEGDVLCGTGNDLINTRLGKIFGSIDAGGGNDTIIGNPTFAEEIQGGDGIDTLDFRKGPSVTIALDGTLTTVGAASGDLVLGIENLIGSNSGNDVLRGDDGANTLEGRGGNDRLEGEGGSDILQGFAGADTLTGGFGADTLDGGLGNDTFFFQTRQDFGDTITAFGGAAGDNDLLQFARSDLGGGLVVGKLASLAFRTRADNLAQDSDDRFVYRTTDTTLWYDEDGNGAAGPLLVATLNPGAIVTASDILIV